MKIINIREALLELDKRTACQYDLTTLYEACKLNDEDRNQLVKYIDAYDHPSVIGGFLASKCEALSEELGDDDVSDLKLIDDINCGEDHTLWSLADKLEDDALELKELTEDITPDEKVAIEARIREAATGVLVGKLGYEEDFVDNYMTIDVDDVDDNTRIKVEVRAEVDYDGLMTLGQALDPIVKEYDKNAYFEPVTSGIMSAYIRKDQSDDVPDEAAVKEWTDRFNACQTKDDVIAVYRDLIKVRDNNEVTFGTIEAIYDVIDAKMDSLGESLNEALFTVPTGYEDYCPYCATRALKGVGDGRAVCDSCGAEYEVTALGNDKVRLDPLFISEAVSNDEWFVGDNESGHMYPNKEAAQKAYDNLVKSGVKNAVMHPVEDASLKEDYDITDEDAVREWARDCKELGITCEDYREFAKIVKDNNITPTEELYRIYLDALNSEEVEESLIEGDQLDSKFADERYEFVPQDGVTYKSYIGDKEVPYETYEDAIAHLKDDFKITDYRADLQQFLTDNDCHHTVNETTDGRLVISINWGDWKHDHIRVDALVDEFFNNKGLVVKTQKETTGEDGSDTYSAEHYYDIDSLYFSRVPVQEALNPRHKHVSSLVAGDIIKDDGVTSTVKSIENKSNCIEVTFEDGSSASYGHKEEVEVLTETIKDAQYGVHSFSQDAIIFRGTEEECGKYIDQHKELWDDAEVYKMTPDDPHYRKEEKLTLSESDDTDILYNTEEPDDYDGIEAGHQFIEDGHEWTLLNQCGETVHLDFDNWAVWWAYRPEIDGDENSTAISGFFVIDVDTGFIDWGPCDTVEEAQQFLQSKVDDYNMDEAIEPEKVFDKDGNEIEPPLGRCKCGKALVAGEGEEPHCPKCGNSSIDECKSINEELWDKARVIDLVRYYLDRSNVPTNTLADLITKQMKEENSKLPSNITDFYDVLYTAIDSYNEQFEESLTEGIKVATIADYITDHYEFDDIDDKYGCINSIKDSFKDEKTISYEVLNQFIGAHNGRDKVEEALTEDKGQPRSKRYTTYFNRIKRAIEKGDEETLQRTKEAIMYAPAKELKNSEASELMDMIKNRKINEASYGGAFDIGDDQYFTKDDLMSFADEVLGHVAETFNGVYDIGGVWFEDGNVITQIVDDSGNEYEDTTHVDMRRIREPWHLKRAYAFNVAANIIQQIKDTDGDVMTENMQGMGEYSDKFHQFLEFLLDEDKPDNIAYLASQLIRYCKEEDLKDLWFDRMQKTAKEVGFGVEDDDSIDEGKKLKEDFDEEQVLRDAQRWFDVEIPDICKDVLDNLHTWPAYRVSYMNKLAKDFYNTCSRYSHQVRESLNESETDAETIETGAAVGMAAVVSDLIKDEYEAIDAYNSAIATAEAEGFGDAVKVLTEIQAEENLHVGQLQEVMKMFDPNADKVEEGQQEGAEQLNNSADSPNNNIEEGVIMENKKAEEIYQSFKTIEKELNQDGEAVTAVIDKMYQDNKHDPDYQKAYDKWASGE